MPVFISHSHDDHAAYGPLCLALDGQGIPRWDVDKIPVGTSLSEQLKQAIQECEACVFLATKRSLKSQWCHAELGAFWGAGKPVAVYVADPEVSASQHPPEFQGNLWTTDIQRLIKITASTPCVSKAAIPTIGYYLDGRSSITL